jgi:hypothetical protein
LGYKSLNQLQTFHHIFKHSFSLKNSQHSVFLTKMARTKTTSRSHSQSPPHAADQHSDHSPLNETAVHTILPDEIIPLFDSPKPKSSKKSAKPKPKATRRSTRMKRGSSSTPTTSHLDLVSDDEKKEKETASEEGTHSEKNESDKTEKVEEELSDKGKEIAQEEANSEETGETLLQMAKTAKKVYQRRKKIAADALPLEKTASPSLENEEVGKEENVEEEVPSLRRGKGKDIAILASALKVQNLEKMAARPLSRAKFFDFESLKTKGWNLEVFTDPQGWSGFVSTQEPTFEDLVKEFYASMRVKEEKGEKFLESTVKGVKFQVTQDSLSNILNIPNQGKQLFNTWFSCSDVTREQLILEYTKPNLDFTSTNLKDAPKILHNMIRHTILPRCGTFDAITDLDLCILYHLMNKTPLNLCYVMIQYMIDQCFSIKQKVAGLPYGMHLTPIFKAVGISLDGEEGQDTFMKFTAKTISQLRLTSTNMPIPQRTESVKRIADQKVQEVRKKQKSDKPTKRETGSSSHNNEKGKPTPAQEVFAHIAEHARELVEASTQQFEAMLARKAVENVGESAEGQQKVEAPSGDIRVEENTEQDAQNVENDTQEVAAILASNTLGSENQQMEVDDEVQVNVGTHSDFDLNIEDTTNDLYNEIFQDAQGEDIQPNDQNVQNNTDQNVQEAGDQNVPTEQLSADPNPLDSGSLPSMEVQHLVQPNQNVQVNQNVPSDQNMEHAQFVNLSTSTMGSTAGISQYLVSSLPTPNTIPSSTPPPPQSRTTPKLPNMSALFDSLNTFVTANREKSEPSHAAEPAKPSKAEKLAVRALRVSTKTHKIVCALADWTKNVHAPGLAIDPPIFDDPSVFESEPSSDSGDSTP